MDRHEDRKREVQRFFGRHADAYALSPGHRSGPDLDRLIQLLDPQPSQRALDVATAAGHTALALAGRVAEVVGLDLTPEMEPVFQREAAARHIGNARFQVGDAEALPFPAASFDLVTSRRAPHHFPNLERALAEMARVLCPGGRLGIVDMAAPEDPQAAALFNALETARDYSHQRALSPQGWQRAVVRTGLRLLALETHDDPLPLTQWLYPVEPDGEEAARVAELIEEAPPAVRNQVVQLTPAGYRYRKRRVILVAEKPR